MAAPLTVSSGVYQEIKASMFTSKVTVGEDAGVVGWPTTDLLIAKPLSTSPARRIPAGLSYTFQRSGGRVFGTGESLGWVSVVTGTTTIFVDEEER